MICSRRWFDTVASCRPSLKAAGPPPPRDKNARGGQQGKDQANNIEAFHGGGPINTNFCQLEPDLRAL